MKFCIIFRRWPRPGPLWQIVISITGPIPNANSQLRWLNRSRAARSLPCLILQICRTSVCVSVANDLDYRKQVATARWSGVDGNLSCADCFILQQFFASIVTYRHTRQSDTAAWRKANPTSCFGTVPAKSRTACSADVGFSCITANRNPFLSRIYASWLGKTDPIGTTDRVHGALQFLPSAGVCVWNFSTLTLILMHRRTMLKSIKYASWTRLLFDRIIKAWSYRR